MNDEEKTKMFHDVFAPKRCESTWQNQGFKEMDRPKENGRRMVPNL